jgi:hypothetical protein
MEYFAKIQEPKKLRLSMMQTAKESILMTSLLGDIEAIKVQKTDLMNEIKDDFKQIDEFCKFMSGIIADEKTRTEIIESAKTFQPKEHTKIKLEVPLPKVHEHKSHHVEVEKDLPKITVNQKSKTEVDRLEYTLSQIEKKIADLSK